MLALTLLFLRVHLFAVNSKQDVNNVDRVRMMWCSMIFFLHLHGVSNITKRNWVMATIATCFLLVRSDVSRPDRTTYEPCEHIFGHARSIIREFSVRDWCMIVRKLAERFELAAKNDFQTSRDRKKGCGSVEAIVAEVFNNSGPVNVTAEESGTSSVVLLWKELRVVINESNMVMTTFLSIVLEVECFHPLVKQFQLTANGLAEDLLQDFINTVQKKENDLFFPKESDAADNANATTLEIDVDDVQVVENDDGDADRDDTDGNERGVDLCGPSSSDIQASYEKDLVDSNIEIARKGEEYEEGEEDKKKRDKAS